MPLALAEAATTSASQLVIAALVGIATIVLLITVAKTHAFLALLAGSFVMAIVAGTPLLDAFDSFTDGLGSTVGGVGVLIVFGSMIGTLLVRSGGADQIVDSIISHTPKARLAWAMALIAMIIGLPLFFEVGVVLLIPVVMLMAKRTGLSPILLGVPALAGLSTLHCFVPPHPGPLIAIDTLGANLGITLAFGIIIGIPVLILSGPVLGTFASRWVPIGPNLTIGADQEPVPEEERPSFATSIAIVAIPVVLMLVQAIFEIFAIEIPVVTTLVHFFGKPLMALLSAIIYGMFALGTRGGRGFRGANKLIGEAFAPIAGILLIVGAGGGFKQTLVDSGIATVLGEWLVAQPISPLLAGWLIAVFIRLATGSATVATITAAGLAAPLAEGLSSPELALMVLAVGAGSNFLSHVNDAGFWLIKEYFGMTVGQTFKTWSLITTLISVFGLVFVLLLSLVF
ncbi:gluconate:H+ symporter [Corynebacterium glucuronolyticum]|uniref:GntT/GntP/DsdX family permease n=1 Tax=Corynebacterium glucuronolyticum TaxID=39791 RepID=UPI003F6E369B